MDEDDIPAFGQRRLRPKEPLTPLTEWRVPAEPAQPDLPGFVAPPRTALLVGAGLALVAVVAALIVFFSEPDVGDLVAATPVPERPTAVKKVPRSTDSFVVHAPIQLPSGMQIDRSSVLNYDLAQWLATTPTSPRTFPVDVITFEPGSAALDDSFQPMLQVLSQILTAYPQTRITIIGNGPGSLGIERATAIRDALLKLAADPGQLATAAGDSSESAPRITARLEMGVGSDLDA
jgi:hypothetical protein